MVAQGGLTQMVHHIFTRCNSKAPAGSATPSYDVQSFASSSRTSLAVAQADSAANNGNGPFRFEQLEMHEESGRSSTSLPLSQNIPLDVSIPHVGGESQDDANLQSYVNIIFRALFPLIPNSSDVSVISKTDSPVDQNHGDHKLTQRDLFVKDAYLVFRALCKLTMKPLNTDRSVSVGFDGIIVSQKHCHLVSVIQNHIQCGQSYFHYILC
jgi:brefeldin A-inhibited guanine nucleotide-exchange protein